MTETIPAELAVRVISAKQSDPGLKRSNNEDFTALYEPNDPAELAYSGCLYVVADGVGGSYKGEKASKYAVEKVLYEYFRDPKTPPADRLSQIMRGVGNDLYAYSVENGTARMASTLVAAVVRGDRLTVANVGDSRAYLIRGGLVRQISRDHNQASELVRGGIITEEEAAHSNIKNVLTRSLGGSQDVDVDIFDDIPLLPGDLVLLCSDGLHRYLNDSSSLLNLIIGGKSGRGSAKAGSGGTPAEICRRMIAFARRSGGADNITALVVSIRPVEESSKATQPVRLPSHPPVLNPDTLLGQPVTRMARPRADSRTGLRIPSLPRLGPGVFAQLSPKQQLLAAGGAVAALLLVILGIFLLVNSTRPDRLILGMALRAQTPTRALTPTLPVEALKPAETQPIATWTVESDTLANTPTPSPVPEMCVHEVVSGDNLSNIYETMGKGYDPAATYTYFTSCDLNTGACTGENKITKENHNTAIIQIGWYFVIEGIDRETCISKKGQMVKITP